MNKKALERFAPAERNSLRAAVEKRLASLGLTGDQPSLFSKWLKEEGEAIIVNKKAYPRSNYQAFQELFNELKKVGYDHLVEELAYTWFNRFMAIRYMEVNSVLPDYVKIIERDPITRRPEIMDNYTHLKVDGAEIEELKIANEEEEAYRILFIASLKQLSVSMPFLFPADQDWTEIGMPENILTPGGIVDRILEEEGLSQSFEAGVESIGWLYQFYMSEKKKQVGGLRNNAVKKEDLPVVTQLFTPRWIVDYMTENTVGKLYDEWQPQNDLSTQWPYYLKHENSKKLLPEFQDNLEQIKFIDPACGSGHILVAAFEHFYEMYLEQGYRRSEIGSLILKNNLFGCDIDWRAAQIANFTLYMKAAETNKRFLRQVTSKVGNVLEIRDSVPLTEEEWKWFAQYEKKIDVLQELIIKFENAKQFGSLIRPANIDYTSLLELLESLKEQQIADLYEEALKQSAISKLIPVLRQAKLLADQYQIVVTNPPYHNKFNPSLKTFLTEEFNDFKSDLYSSFIARCLEMATKNGYIGMMTPFTWMFISSHEKLRRHIVSKFSFSSLVQLEYSAFEEATVPICTFVIQKQDKDPVGEYIRLSELRGDQGNFLREAVINNAVSYRYRVNSKNFNNIPGAPIAYWADESIYAAFKNYPSLDEVADVRVGLQTSDNERFLRFWWEVDYSKIGFQMENAIEAKNSRKKWFPFNKGGEFRKWYGNMEYVINWENDGKEIKEFATAKYKNYTRTLKNLNFMFRDGATWSAISSSRLAVRYQPKGVLFSNAGMTVFSNSMEKTTGIIGLLNSDTIWGLIQNLSSTINFDAGILKRLPYTMPDEDSKIITNDLIRIAKQEWDSKETSYDFLGKLHENEFNIKEYVVLNQTQISEWINEMLTKETILNEKVSGLFNIGIEENINKQKLVEKTIRPLSSLQINKEFLSYFIGCTLGRFSLAKKGIVYAGGEWRESNYSLYQPVKDGILTFTDEQVLPDEQDVYKQLQKFLSILYGEETLQDNLSFIAEALGKKPRETVEQAIRRYFMTDFIKDHIQLYKKRPIYWLIDSGKHKGMQSLMYLHRYTPYTLGLAMQNHFVPLLSQWRNLERVTLEEFENGEVTPVVKKELTKKLEVYQNRRIELETFQDKLNQLARKEIPIDLDDGVKENYQMLEDILISIKF
ncbi:BREX-1 system adenine-specific DNA-methyltransferase PglX [Planomicrobium chinense]|uniref:BREX-1 system adenine-specific DNA-methyltransferase PglX n=1 Tax=Planococcus chinensis TaxID=272917 RepID=UPI001CC61FB7|nr:BREX-1 system adenine-specific DNA-methyltransferase PglX [Planococcus chinensis]MBZ5201994.1 BREX-1 system adenine-specific DNA-methyltransferase PglX [Planococcus chinensis]